MWKGDGSGLANLESLTEIIVVDISDPDIMFIWVGNDC